MKKHQLQRNARSLRLRNEWYCYLLLFTKHVCVFAETLTLNFFSRRYKKYVKDIGDWITTLLEYWSVEVNDLKYMI